MAVIYRGEGGVGALERLASGPDAAVAETARVRLASVLADVRRSVAQIWRGDRPVGLAVFVDTHKLATMNHVVQERGERDPTASLTARVGEAQLPVTVESSSDEPRDVAILTSEVPGKPLRIGSTAKLAIGEGVTIAAFAVDRLNPESVAIQIVSAHIEGLVADGNIKLSDVRIERGFGGAPVLDTTGAMVGMIVATNDPNSRAGGLAIPVDVIVGALGEPSSGQ
jgi:S1-C subfamily serine protease